MTDPLKNKFKHFTFKLYDKDLRHDKEYFDERYQEFKDHSSIQIIDSWYDYDTHVGIHRNGVFKSTSYKTLNSKFSRKDTKIDGVYLNFGDLPSMHEYNAWIIYCIRRYDTNYKMYLPPQRWTTEGSQPNLREDEEDNENKDKIVF